MEPDELAFHSLEAVLELHDLVTKKPGTPKGVRDPEKLRSALGAVQQSAYYGDPDLFDIAAAYAFYLAERQPFVEGNKPTGWMAADGFLKANGIRADFAQDRVEQWMVDLGTHKLDRHALAQAMREDFEEAWSREKDL